MEMNNCVAVVTGGASGLGEAVVRGMVAKGGKAAILDFDADRGEKLAADLGDDVIFCKTDVTDETSVQSAVQAATAFGGLHGSIQCAGVGWAEKLLGKSGPHGSRRGGSPANPSRSTCDRFTKAAG